jgi:iron complex transport system ATP-binding protein
MKNNTILEIRELQFKYGNEFALSIPSLNVRKGEFVYLLGLNGSGKTTLFYLLAHVLSPSQGVILIKGEDSRRMEPLLIARTIALVEQETHYVFPYSVREVVMMGRFAHNQGHYFESEEDKAKVEQALHQMGIYHLKDRLITELSGGERRRVEIARAFCQETDIILLDEPTTFLDIKQQELFLACVRALHHSGKTIICITHRLDIVKQYGGRIIVLKQGVITDDATVENGFDVGTIAQHFV